MISRFLKPSKENSFYPYLIRKSALAAYTLLIFTFNMVFGFLLPAETRVAASSVSASTLISLTNQERQNSGLNTLSTNAKLTSAAHAKAQDMLAKDYWSHYGPNGETPWQFITGAGYAYVYAGENLAKGFVTSEGVHQAWMASPTHRANIVGANYRDIGIAVVEGELQGEDTILVVQMFGSTTAQAPSSGGTSSGTGGSSGGSTTSGSSGGSQPTPQNTPTPEPPKDQKGEIKSISITSPANKAVINKADFEIEGEIDVVEAVVGSYEVEITEGKIEITSVKTSKEEWSASKGSDWSEGKHTVKAAVTQDDKTFEDSVEFTVDTKPPEFNAASVTTIYNTEKESWRVSILSEEENVTAVLSVGSESYAMQVDADGFLSTTVPSQSIEGAESVKIILADSLGNIAENELSATFVKPTFGESVAQTETSGIEKTFNLGTLSTQAKLNLLFGVFILTLLGIQIYYYRKLGSIHNIGGYLFTIGVFGFLIVVGALTGAVGSIE